MSAFILGKDHIDYLVESIVWTEGHSAFDSRIAVPVAPHELPRLPLGTVDKGMSGYVFLPGRNPDSLAFVGFELWRVNALSVQTRYPMKTRCRDRSTPPVAALYVRESVPHSLISPQQTIRAIRCWRYQSCEHDEWSSTLGARIIDHLFTATVDLLVELTRSEPLAWEWERPTSTTPPRLRAASE